MMNPSAKTLGAALALMLAASGLTFAATEALQHRDHFTRADYDDDAGEGHGRHPGRDDDARAGLSVCSDAATQCPPAQKAPANGLFAPGATPRAQVN